MVSTSYVAVAVKRNPREALNSAIARMPQPIPFSPDADRVLVKPSIYDPSLPGNTSLQMMSAVTGFFKGVTPLSIIESDNPVRTTEEAFEKSGYAALVGENVELFNLTNDKQHLTRFAGNGIQEEYVAELLHNHKFLVNVATLKLQNNTVFGAGIKNLFGLLGRQDKNVLHSDIDGVLLDLLIQFRPSLSIIDLTEVVIGNRSDKHTIPLGGVIVGIDPVAVDAYCAHLLGFDPLKIKYIQRAFEAGLGEALPERIQELGTEYQIQKIKDAFHFSTTP